MITAQDDVFLPARGPFDRRSAIATLAAHAVDGVHRVDLERSHMARLVAGPAPGPRAGPSAGARAGSGPGADDRDAVLVEVTLEERGVGLRVGSDDEPLRRRLESAVRHWFDLDADMGPVNEHLGRHAIFGEQVRRRPGVRITRFADPFETAILTVLGQHVSLAAARLFASRLVEECDAAEGAGDLRLFPTPTQISALSPERIQATTRTTGARARTVHDVASLFVAAAHDAPPVPSHPAPTDPAPSPEPSHPTPTREDLARIKGIGPWTLDYWAIRSGASTDAFPASDAALRRLLNAHGFTEHQREAARWSPYRSYAASRLWAEALDGV